LKLNAAGNAAMPVADSVIQYFRDVNALNRYRDIALGKDGISIYLLTDSVGSTSGPTAGQNGGITDRGCIVEFKYTGLIVSLQEDTLHPVSARLSIKIYPNPTTSVLTIESKRAVDKPITYQLHDIAGRPVIKGQSRKDKFDLKVENLPGGIYLLSLYNGRDVHLVTAKIILQ
jgi:hypothetical protein